MPAPRAWRRLPLPVRFLMSHGTLGFGIAGAFVAGFLLADPGGGGAVLLHAAGHWWPAALLWLMLGPGFAAVQIGVATFLLAEAAGGRRRPQGGSKVPVLVPVVPRRR